MSTLKAFPAMQTQLVLTQWDPTCDPGYSGYGFKCRCIHFISYQENDTQYFHNNVAVARNGKTDSYLQLFLILLNI